jgi:hypothetical protein
MSAFIRVHQGTPEALLEQPNLSKTAADSKGHTNFFMLRSSLRCCVTAVVIKVKTEVHSPSLDCARGFEISDALLECAAARNSTVAGVVGWATNQ